MDFWIEKFGDSVIRDLENEMMTRREADGTEREQQVKRETLKKIEEIKISYQQTLKNLLNHQINEVNLVTLLHVFIFKLTFVIFKLTTFIRNFLLLIGKLNFLNKNRIKK